MTITPGDEMTDEAPDWETIAVQSQLLGTQVINELNQKLSRIRKLLDDRAMDPHLRNEFLAAIEHSEGCGCYYCLGPRPGISPPPLTIEDDVDALVDWQLKNRPSGDNPAMVWRGCENDHAWQTDAEALTPCPECGQAAT